MITLLIINAVFTGLIGLSFSLFGSNVQSRIFGLVSMLICITNLLAITGVFTIGLN